MRARGHGGQAIPFVVAMVVVTGGLLIVLARIGSMVVDHARARTAADAAALAGAVQGESAADATAAANGGTVLEFRQDGAAVEVLVRVGVAEARARARRGLSAAAEATAIDKP